MQPKIVENFISSETAKYINDYFVKNIPLDGQGYSNISIKKTLPFYNHNYLFNTLKNKNVDEALFHDTLRLIMVSMKANFDLAANEIDAEFFNYRNFTSGMDFKDYHIDDYGGPGNLFTALLYLTDDYEGGEIIFYDGDFPSKEGETTYSPKAGDLYLFRGVDAHKVNPVISGRRALFSMNLRNPPIED